MKFLPDLSGAQLYSILKNFDVSSQGSPKFHVFAPTMQFERPLHMRITRDSAVALLQLLCVLFLSGRGQVVLSSLPHMTDVTEIISSDGHTMLYDKSSQTVAETVRIHNIYRTKTHFIPTFSERYAKTDCTEKI